MSKRFPSQFGNEPQYHNPSGTIPMPQPREMPKAVWTQPRLALEWGTPLAVGPGTGSLWPEGWLWTVSWATPFFDMRPDLRSSQGQTKEGVPMWRIGARLYVELIGLLTTPTAPGSPIYLATTNEWYALFNNEPGRLPVILGGTPDQANMTPTTNASQTFFAPAPGTCASLGVFSPLGDGAGGGEGYPVRYWKLRLNLTRFVEASTLLPAPILTNAQQFKIEAAVY